MSLRRYKEKGVDLLKDKIDEKLWDGLASNQRIEGRIDGSVQGMEEKTEAAMQLATTKFLVMSVKIQVTVRIKFKAATLVQDHSRL